ncbi:DUF6933 domain-containing protein [Chloroflexota bacterium]
MGIIRCTAKLLAELKTKPTNGLSQSSAWCDWHANLLWVDRKKCVLFTNNPTLYSFFLPSIKKSILKNFEEVFRLSLFKSLIAEGFAEPQVEYVLRQHQHIVIAKTNSRSILGSMNDLAFQIKSMISATGGLANADLSEINRHLNRIPMSAIKYKVSIDELKRLLADTGR